MKKILFGSLVFISACGQSPLLNHTYATHGIKENATSTSSSCLFDFKKANLCATLAWIKNPTAEEAGEFTLKFWNKSNPNGQTILPTQKVSVKLWMPAMGHGSSPTTINPTKEGFDVTQVYFMMSGRWEIWVQIKDGSNLLDQAKYELDF